MNPLPPNDTVSRNLPAWRVNPPADPNFRPAVWQRIQARTRSTWAAYMRDRFVGWSVVGTLAVVAAGWTGHSLAQEKLAAEREKMVVSYLGGLDPRVLAKLRP